VPVALLEVDEDVDLAVLVSRTPTSQKCEAVPRRARI